MARVSGAVFRGGLEPPQVTGSFPARDHPARAFPPRAPPGYLFSGDAEHAKAGWRYRVGTRWPPMVMTARAGFHSPRGPFSLWLARSGHCATVQSCLGEQGRTA